MKRRNIVILAVVGLLLGWCAYRLTRTPEGHWYGTLTYNNNVLRIAQVIEKNRRRIWSSSYDSLEYGSFGVPLKDITVSDRFVHMVAQEGAVLDLYLDWTGDRLYGTSTAQGISGSVTLRRGRDYSVPRVGFGGKAVSAYAYRPPRYRDDGLEVGDIRRQDVDLRLLESGVRDILQNRHYPHLYSLLVVRGGKLVLEEYFFGYKHRDVFQVRSVTGTVFSILFGIAQDKGLVSVDEKLYDYYPEYRKRPGWQAKKDKVTLGMMLSMTSGFSCDNRVLPPAPCVNDYWGSPDWVGYALSMPLDHEPGTRYAYCGPCLIPAAMIVDRKSRMIIPEFANKNLFSPLGIISVRWMLGPNGVPDIEGGLFLKPRDMAKLGLLMLSSGVWKGKRIVSEKWVEESTSFQVRFPDGRGIGYLWTREHVPVHGKNVVTYHTMGRGGQSILVVPQMDLVAVTTAGNYLDDQLSAQPFQLLQRYILNAIF